MSDDFHIRLTPEDAARSRGRLGIDWEAIDAQVLPTTPAVVSSVALGFAAPLGMAASTLVFLASSTSGMGRSRALSAAAFFTATAAIAYVIAALAGAGAMRGPATRRRLLGLASSILSRFTSPEAFRRRLNDIASNIEGRVDSAFGAPIALAAGALLVAEVVLAATGILTPWSLTGGVPAVIVALTWHHETRQMSRHSGARARVHTKSAFIAARTAREVTLFALGHAVVLAAIEAVRG